MKFGTLKPFQLKAAERCDFSQRRIYICDGKMGTGKTFIAGEIAMRIEADVSKDYFSQFALSNVLWVTRASIVKQTERTIRKYFGASSKQVDFISYNGLLTGEGEKYIQEKPNKENPDAEWKWRVGVNPLLIVIDECHRLKNFYSKAAQCLFAASKIPNIKFLLLSGTLGEKIDDLEFFTRIAGEEHGFNSDPRNTHWNTYCSVMAKGYAGSRIARHMSNMRGALENNFISLPNIRTKYKAHNNIALCGFANSEDKTHHAKAMDDYMKELEACGKHAPGEAMMRLVALNKYRERCDTLKVNVLLPRIKHDVSEGFRITVAVNFQHTVALLVSKLIASGMKREEISVIWGGSDLFKQQEGYSKEEIYATFGLALSNPEDAANQSKLKKILLWIKQKSRGIDQLGDLSEIGLSKQSFDERQDEVDKFVSGNARVCIYTISAGGTGLSLHDCDDYYITRPECYNVIKDSNGELTSITSKDTNEEHLHKLTPIRSYQCPSWSAMDILQSFYRAHRLTSRSDTHQYAIFFAGTVENNVANIIAPKFAGMAAITKLSKLLMDDESLTKDVATSKQYIGYNFEPVSNYIQEEVDEVEVEDED